MLSRVLGTRMYLDLAVTSWHHPVGLKKEFCFACVQVDLFSCKLRLQEIYYQMLLSVIIVCIS